MISFVIPTKNEEKTVEKTLQCVAGYSGEHEIIVSDGASTDGTIEIAGRYTDKIAIYKGGARQTIAAGRNAGVAIAKGDFIVFLDADVYIPDINSFMEKACGFFKSDARLVALTVSYKVLPENETFSDKLVFNFMNFCYRILNNVIKFGGSGGEFQMIRTEIFKKVGGFNETLVSAEDNELFWRLAKIGRTHFEGSLCIYHSGRREHIIGWPRLLYQWFVGYVTVLLFRKSALKEWTEIR